MNLVHLLDAIAQQSPDQAALIHGQQQCSFAALHEASSRGAGWLQSHGIGKGDHVLVLSPMGIPLYEVLLACWRCGACVVVVDPAAGAAAFEQAMDHLQPKAFIGSSLALLLRWRYRCLHRIPLVISTGWGLLHRPWRKHQKATAFGEACPVSADSAALITFTSGSTGRPKGAIRSHGILAAQHAAIAKHLGHRSGAVDLVTLPIFALASLASGMTTVIPPVNLTKVGEVDGAIVRRCIEDYQVESLTASPAFFKRLLDGSPLPLKRAFTGGAPIFPGFWQQLHNALRESDSTSQAVAIYGSTEAEPIAHCAWPDVRDEDRQRMADGHGLLAGEIVPETTLRILSYDGPAGPWTAEELNHHCADSNEIGEIIVSGAHVLPGYLGGHGDAEHKINVDGLIYHRTGDAGYTDDQGRLWLVGRCSARIEDEHGVCYPFAVEAAALSQSAIRRAACIAHNGQRLLCIEGDMTEAHKAKLSQHFHLGDIREMTIPVDRRHQAKVDYKRLKALLSAN